MYRSRLDPSSAQRELTPTRPVSIDSVVDARRSAECVEPSRRGPQKLILCFDGTGNKFHGDDSDSNILKIFRMLDRTASDQYHYYQPGIGTYVVSGSLTHSSVRARFNSWYSKAKDSAIGSSFDHHVVGGYRFLMRFYNPGDEIYMFGFSRGAYIARFLAEMLDYIGLLSHGNEEMVRFAWKAFSQWQCRQGLGGDDQHDEKKKQLEEAEKRKMYNFLKGFRETFSRPVGRIRFLGLFDTVNSVPRFETAWMQRSKFPYTARSSAKVIRHAVSIDERRAKFRQDLMYQDNPKTKNRKHRHLGRWTDVHRRLRRDFTGGEVNNSETFGNTDEKESDGKLASHLRPTGTRTNSRQQNGTQTNGARTNGDGNRDRGRQLRKQTSRYLSPQGREKTQHNASGGSYAPYRARSRSQNRPVTPQQQERYLSHPHDDAMSSNSGFSPSEVDPNWDDEGQDIDEVWFAGGHADIGGGWEVLEDRKAASHIPLVWMVREAMRAGLSFDPEKVANMGCSCCSHWDPHNPSKRHPEDKKAQKKANIPYIQIQGSTQPDEEQTDAQDDVDVKVDVNGDGVIDEEDEIETSFRDLIGKSYTARIHDSLAFGGGLPWTSVFAWKLMEWLPFRRMDLLVDGSWEPIRWPLPRGEVRDIPYNVRVHGSVIRRMQEDESYRPGNLIIGGGGRGTKVAPTKYGLGQWVCVAEKGDPIGEIWTRDLEKTAEEKKAEEEKKQKEKEKGKEKKKEKEKKRQ